MVTWLLLRQRMFVGTSCALMALTGSHHAIRHLILIRILVALALAATSICGLMAAVIVFGDRIATLKRNADFVDAHAAARLRMMAAHGKSEKGTSGGSVLSSGKLTTVGLFSYFLS
jgi:hypothetical protein